MKKKFKSKFFCVATEGATTDGRTITAEWIRQMADSFDRKTYGARVWLEHMRGLFPDGPFKAYGDVLALEAREKEDGKLGLYAQIEPTEDLIQINQSRQKIYTSIEVNPDFAGSGKAYLMGLAITDSPASLGTEMLEFTQKNPSGSPLTGRKFEKDNVFSAAAEADIELIEVEDKPSLSDRAKSLVAKFRAKTEQTDADLSVVLDAVEQVIEHSLESDQRVQELTAQMTSLTERLSKVDDLETSFMNFKKQIETTDADSSVRPPASGGDGSVQTDC